MVTEAMKLKDACFLEEKLWPTYHIKKQRHYLVHKGLSSQSYGFSNSHVWMWESDHKETSVVKNWCFWTVVLEKTLESSLDYKKIKPGNPKGNQSWMFFGSTDAVAAPPILLLPDAMNWLDWRQEKGKTKDEMARWHHQRNGHEFGHDLSVGCGQGILACCIPLGHKELDMIERVNWNDGDIKKISFARGRQEEQMEYKDLGAVKLHCMMLQQ